MPLARWLQVRSHNRAGHMRILPLESSQRRSRFFKEIENLYRYSQGFFSGIPSPEPSSQQYHLWSQRRAEFLVEPAGVQFIVWPPQQRLYFFPEPHGHGSFRPIFVLVL
jgi:hypothetical protein